ncbi:hypothetical protein Tco_1304144 [Tanacetum coccineum]
MFPRRSEGEELEYSFFEGDGLSSDKWGDYGVAGDDFEGPPVFNDDQYEEVSVPVYNTDIEDVIKEEEGFVKKGGFGGEEDKIEDVVVVANDLCSSMIQTTLNVNFEEDINTRSHELMSFGKIILIKVSKSSFKFLIGKKYQEWYLKVAPMVDEFGFKTIKVRGSGSQFDTAYLRDWIRRIGVSWSRDHVLYLPEYSHTISSIRHINFFWIRRIDLLSFVVFGECRHGYAVSSLMDTAYW